MECPNFLYHVVQKNVNEHEDYESDFEMDSKIPMLYKESIVFQYVNNSKDVIMNINTTKGIWTGLRAEKPCDKFEVELLSNW